VQKSAQEYERKGLERRGQVASDEVASSGIVGPTPGFCVSVASKRVSLSVSLLFATFARGSIGVAAKGLKAILDSGQWIRCTERMLRFARRPGQTCSDRRG
jgi:hypothetical protein